jgi:hypothetical protein
MNAIRLERKRDINPIINYDLYPSLARNAHGGSGVSIEFLRRKSFFP